MTRNLKALLAAAMALTVFGALSATAHAAEEKFHCSVEPCTLTLSPDGTGTTAHHVLIVKNAGGESSSIKCSGLSGHATTLTKATESVTATGLVYSTCKVNGSSPLVLRMNLCDYKFTSKLSGVLLGAQVHVECPTEKHIELEIPETGCIFTVTPQTATGIFYHNIGVKGSGLTETTVEVRLKNLSVEVAKVGTGCLPKAEVGQTLSAEYTTGNTLVTAEKDNVNKEMVEGWWE